MNDIDFIKKSVPFADGFELMNDGDEIFPEMVLYFDGYGIDAESGDVKNRVQYKHFLTRTIEGINSKTGYTIITWLDTITICMGWDYITPIFVAKYNYSEQGDIDTAKRSAIEYVLERL